ncbi:DUF2264 domain-containing protein [Gryllotalpicola ginsengisoli]|uniref:DUF2264 domain-containing protein n=1 Tax=Gryllotalpicola ginsengisoli TaxID=444608 RepID=UPI0003B79823|nr:DUF2264 domain-containing protein [Gryllotalpicola ginsengisoli]
MSLTLPSLDYSLSPRTGFTRAHWAAVADQLLLALRPFFSPGRARVRLPGRTSSSGHDSDELEGFARSLLLVGFRIAGEQGADPHGFLDWYRAGLIAGTDPQSPERWPTPGELGQAKVEAASLALVLELTRPWLWDTLAPDEQRNVVAWFETAVGGWYPRNNWVWFRAVVETFVAAEGGRIEASDITAALDFHEACAREGGWYSDSDEMRAFDYYSGWAMQFYPFVWAAQPGAAPFDPGARLPLWRARLADYLDDYVRLIGGDGMPVLQGRSLIYRFAAAAPLWAGAAHDATRLDPGLVRRAASGMLQAFLDHGAVSESGLLTMGLTREWPQLAQTYSGPASPYWASKGFYGLVLPATHPVWTAVEQPLPVELSDERRAVVAPGWAVSGTAADGIVRIVNHGTDHEVPGSADADSPLYARLGYSSATMTLVTDAALEAQTDQLATVLDAAGRVASRAGFEPLGVADGEVAATAASRAHAHWVDIDRTQRDHGSGYSGEVTWGPTLTVASAVRGAWEVRALRLDGPSEGAVAFRVSGWPVGADAWADGLWSELVPLAGCGDAAVERVRVAGQSPLVDVVEVPQLTVPIGGAGTGGLLVVAVGLGRAPETAPTTVVTGSTVAIGWGDGAQSELVVPA